MPKGRAKSNSGPRRSLPRACRTCPLNSVARETIFDSHSLTVEVEKAYVSCIKIDTDTLDEDQRYAPMPKRKHDGVDLS